MLIKDKIIQTIMCFSILIFFTVNISAEEFNIEAKEIAIDEKNNILVGKGSVKVTDSAGRSASFPYIFGVSVSGERQTVVARGGSIVIDIRGNEVIYIENVPNDGFIGYLISPGPEKVQFHFISNNNQLPSWIFCELGNESICDFD